MLVVAVRAPRTADAWEETRENVMRATGCSEVTIARRAGNRLVVVIPSGGYLDFHKIVEVDPSATIIE